MAKKKLKSGLILTGISPKILLGNIESTAPFIFKGMVDTTGPSPAYLAKLIFYKNNLALLKNIDLTEYFYLCLSAHWATAGTFVPTDVDNQIREGLWRHEVVGKHLEKMTRLTIESWTWDYSQVTNRKAYLPGRDLIMSTHEGTWLSVAIGAYCALKKNNRGSLATEVSDTILAEIEKEQNFLLELQEKRDTLNFLRATALMAHNFGDLDRVIDQWKMSDQDSFKERIYKLGHKLNKSYSPILYYAGLVNKEFLSVENHRHMSLRQPKCLRRSPHYLLPVGPFMDNWGELIGKDLDLNLTDKAEIITALFEGYKRQNKAFGYIRAYKGIMGNLAQGSRSLDPYLAADLLKEIKISPFSKSSLISKEEFEEKLSNRMLNFTSPLVDFKF
jgi:hypothetical protein